MRKVTYAAVNAFSEDKPLKQGNTTISIEDGITTMRLFGHRIAVKRGDTIAISSAGFQTNTTKERLNGVMCRFGKGGISQQKGIWYFANGEVVPSDQWTVL